MTNEEFKKIVESRIAKIYSTLTVKGEEYTKSNDRLLNFYDAAYLNGVAPEKALWGFVTKHIIALKDFIKTPYDVKSDQFEEKIGDIICYMILLEALLSETGYITNED